MDILKIIQPEYYVLRNIEYGRIFQTINILYILYAFQKLPNF